MKFFCENETKGLEERGMREHFEKHPGGHPRPIPPHERRSLFNVQFDEHDMALMQEIFGDEDTANAAADIIMTAPPEIKILSVQLLKMIEEAD